MLVPAKLQPTPNALLPAIGHHLKYDWGSKVYGEIIVRIKN